MTIRRTFSAAAVLALLVLPRPAQAMGADTLISGQDGGCVSGPLTNHVSIAGGMSWPDRKPTRAASFSKPQELAQSRQPRQG
jgi:hypothetical protein